MERKKLPNDLDLQHLLDVASDTSEAAPVVDEVSFKNDIPLFITKYGLASGNNPVKTRAIYRLYKRFSKNPVTSNAFGIELSLYIAKEKDYYLINKSPTELIVDYSSAIKQKRNPRIRHRTTKVQFQAYLNKYEVQAGTEWMEEHIVVYFYDRWIYENDKKRKLKPADVVSLMKAFFEYRNTKDGYVFKIKHNFPQQSVDNLRESWKKRKQKGQKLNTQR